MSRTANRYTKSCQPRIDNCIPTRNISINFLGSTHCKLIRALVLIDWIACTKFSIKLRDDDSVFHGQGNQ